MLSHNRLIEKYPIFNFERRNFEALFGYLGRRLNWFSEQAICCLLLIVKILVGLDVQLYTSILSICTPRPEVSTLFLRNLK